MVHFSLTFHYFSCFSLYLFSFLFFPHRHTFFGADFLLHFSHSSFSKYFPFFYISPFLLFCFLSFAPFLTFSFFLLSLLFFSSSFFLISHPLLLYLSCHQSFSHLFFLDVFSSLKNVNFLADPFNFISFNCQ